MADFEHAHWKAIRRQCMYRNNTMYAMRPLPTLYELQIKLLFRVPRAASELFSRLKLVQHVHPPRLERDASYWLDQFPPFEPLDDLVDLRLLQTRRDLDVPDPDTLISALLDQLEHQLVLGLKVLQYMCHEHGKGIC